MSGILSTILSAVGAQSPVEPVKPIEAIARKLATAEAAISELAQKRREANFRHELDEDDTSRRELLAATDALEAGHQRVTNLKEALMVAQERQRAGEQAVSTAAHEARLKALAAHTTSWRRAVKNLGARLDRTVAAWNEVAAATAKLVATYPPGHRFPEGVMTSWPELQRAVLEEVTRLSAVAAGDEWDHIGQGHHHFLGVRPTGRVVGGDQNLATLEDKATLAANRLLELAGGVRVSVASAVPAVAVRPSVETVEPAVVEPDRAQIRLVVPSAPVNAALADLEAQTLREMQAAASLAAMEAATMEEIRMQQVAQSDATAATELVTDGDTDAE